MRIFALIMMIYALPALSADISINKVSLWYLDNITNPNKPTARELTSLQDDEFWSKPEYVDIEVIIENKSPTEAENIRLKAEQFYLLSYRSSGTEYPSLKNEIRDISKTPVWAWSKNLGNGFIKILKPGQVQSFVFKHIKVKENYYATEYSFNAYAIKVYAESKGIDENIKNNMNYKIVQYGD